MNILIYFSKPLNPHSGGTERVAYIIACYLKKIGHMVVEMPELPDVCEGPTTSNVTFIVNYINRNAIDVIINESGNSDAIFLFSHKYIPKQIKIITHLHFDIYGDITSFYKSYHLPILGVSVLESISNIARWIKMPFNKRLAIKRKRDRYRFMYENSDHIVLLTEKHVDDFNNLIGVKTGEKVVSVTNPISYDSTRIPKKKDNIAIFVGRLEYPKRVDRIIRAWTIIQKTHPDWSLYIIGDGSDKQRLMDLVSRYKLRSVIFTGQTDPTIYYEKAKLLLMTSNYEGTPMVIYEGMSHGVVPIVMSSFTAARKMIDDGMDGLVTKAFNIRELAKACICLIDDASRLKMMSGNSILKIKGIDNNSLLHKWKELLK